MHVEFGTPENVKVFGISDTKKVFLIMLYETGNLLGNQKGFLRAFPGWFKFSRERLF
jgi:hypothetical protein